MPDTTVIIPTTAAITRRLSLKNAIESIFLATSRDVTILVVVNGDRKSPEVIRMLELFKQVHIEYRAFASAPLACLEGRRLVSTPYYCFLDDDDEYLANTIDERINKIESDEKFDFVITNGYQNIAGVDRMYLTEMESIPSDPMVALFSRNWLPSCGGLFRTDRIGTGFFENPHQYVEWTWLAFKLIINGKELGIFDMPGYRINDTSDSSSKSADYFLAIYQLYQKLLQYPLPPQTVRLINSRIGNWFHCNAEQKWQQGLMLDAWRSHFRSLNFPHGWRYLTFTRKLLKTKN